MIVAGFGCRADAPPEAFAAALAATGVSRVDRVATPAHRAALLAPLARDLGVSLVALAPEQLAGVVTPTQSPISLSTRGTGSVAEAAAIVAAGAEARITATRHVSPDRTVTCAIAVSGWCA